jgi:sRNA-binding carbon storage regulator CsrA
MLTFNRSSGESLIIQPYEDTPLDMTIRELFADGPIIITTTDSQLRISVDAPNNLLIIKNEELELNSGFTSIDNSAA